MAAASAAPPRSSTASRPRSPPASRRSRSTAVVQRGVNDHTALDLVERFRGTGVIVRFIEYMDVGNRNHWRPAARRAVARAARAPSHARWPLVPLAANYRGEVAERYALRRRPGRGRLHLVGQPAVLRRLLARAAVVRGHAVHLPVREPRPRPAHGAARRRGRRRAARADPRRLARPQRPLQRGSAPNCTPPAASARSRCTTSEADEHASRTSAATGGRRWSTSATRRSRAAQRGGGVAGAPARRRSRARSRAAGYATAKGPVFHTAIIAGDDGRQAHPRADSLLPPARPREVPHRDRRPTATTS